MINPSPETELKEFKRASTKFQDLDKQLIDKKGMTLQEAITFHIYCKTIRISTHKSEVDSIPVFQQQDNGEVVFSNTPIGADFKLVGYLNNSEYRIIKNTCKIACPSQSRIT